MRKELSAIALSSLLLTACSANAEDIHSSDSMTEDLTTITAESTMNEVNSEDYYIFEMDDYLFDLNYELSETDPNKEIEELIKNYAFIDQEIPDNNFYSYQYYDLNEDGQDEAIVVLSGSSFSGNGGDSMIILTPSENQWEILSNHSLVRQPIIVSNEMTNGFYDLIFLSSGGGHNNQLHESAFDGQTYPLNPSTEPIIQRNIISGTSIFSDKAFNASFSERSQILHPLK